MKRLFIVGNWKSNKTALEANTWLQEVHSLQFTVHSNKEVIVCVPFTLLSNLKSHIINFKSPIKLGAQNISMFDEGAYTGEINGRQIKEFAEYVLIGHSERRKYFGESEEIIKQKLYMAQKYELIPILCVSDIDQIQKSKFKNQNSKMIIAYEPLFAIGSGNPDTPENANEMAKKIKSIVSAPVIYGGSVTEKNVASFTAMSYIDGVLPGKVSLDPHIFVSLITNA